MRHVTTALMGGAGLAWTLGQAVLPDMGLQDEERYAAVAADRGLETASAALLVLAAAGLVVGTLGLARRLPPTRLLAVGTALTALGALWLVGGRGAFNLAFYRLTDPDVPEEAALAFLSADVGVGFVPLLLMLPALLIGPVVLSVGLRRAGLAGWAPLVLWVLGIATFLASEFTVKAGEVVGVGVAALALALIGRAADGSPANDAGAPGRPPAV